MIHKFEKVLAKHGFKLAVIKKKDFCGNLSDMIYKKEGIEGWISFTVWPNSSKGEQCIVHYFKQSNGIIAPSICETAPQLDRNLTRNYSENKD